MLASKAHTAYEITGTHTYIYTEKTAAQAAEGVGVFYDLPPNMNTFAAGQRRERSL
jgi:hypothetical protein